LFPQMLNATLIVLLFICGIGFEDQFCAVDATDDVGTVAQHSVPADAEPNSLLPAASMGEARVYEVRKKVSNFPDHEDLSTPEAAYATIHRAYAAEAMPPGGG